MDDNVNSDCVLRDAAEDKLRRSQNVSSELKDKTPEAIIHELQVHQIELEMQNEELRRSQAEVDRSKNRYADLYDHAPIGYVTLDKNSLVLESNFSAASLLGTERGSLIGKPLTSFIHEDTQDTFYFHRSQVLQTGTRHICEIKLAQPDGGWIHVQLESVGMEESPGKFVGLRTSISDITARKLAEKALQEAHNELEKRVEERTSELLEANKQLKQEIVERKQAEKYLRKSEQGLSLVLRGAGLGSWDYNIQTNETIVRPAPGRNARI
jgi:PAS domain S-box-containing protein